MRYIFASFLLALSVVCTQADEIAIWNFNDGNLTVDRSTRTASMTTNFESSNVTYFSGSSINARGGDAAGSALALQGGSNTINNGRTLTWLVDTTGYTSIQVSFATQRTSTGFNNNVFQYTLDGGGNWTTFSSYTPPTSFALQSFNLSAIAGLNNNPQAGFRIIFNGATSDSGNNRLDNLVVEGTLQQTTPVPEPSVLLLFGSGLIGLGVRCRRRGKDRLKA